MKKSNLITVLLFAAMITGAAVFTTLHSSVAKTPDDSFTSQYDSVQSHPEILSATDTEDLSANEKDTLQISPDVFSETNKYQQHNPGSPPDSEQNNTQETVQTDTITEETAVNNNIPPVQDTVRTEDALFIGDSRTVGLSEYAEMKNTDFFANVGMTVYNIRKKTVSVPGVGKVTLHELLEGKKYGRIYLMLGINEIGYNTEKTVRKYRELIVFIQEKQPNASIFIQANLHVDKGRSSKDTVINNPAINGLNSAISEIADGRNIFYLDVNIIFDDEDGNLSAEKTGDGTHPYAKYYYEWGRWLEAQTRTLTGKGSNP